MHIRRLPSLLALTAVAALIAAGCAPFLGGDAGPGALVTDSGNCARCHANSPDASAMRDGSDRPIAPFDLWRSTMMANSARDPFWRAQLAAELAATPSRSEEILETCLRCHAPMASLRGLARHEGDSELHVLECDERLGVLARDGVSCTICHGISPAGLGREESFSAGFELDPGRRLFGPHAGPFAMPMMRMTGFTPTRGEHVLDSALCGSCHTLETEAFDADGRATGGGVLEQSPYLEWRNSAYVDEGGERGPRAATCQDCHVPTLDADGRAVSTRIARNPAGRDFGAIDQRSPYGRHLFVGGNTLVLSLLRDHAEELGVEAPAAAFDATIAATRAQLEERTAVLAIEDVELAGDQLRFDVLVRNETGHKLPTGHPSRRAWLCVRVRAADGETLFASGGFDEQGRILGADGRPLASEAAGGPTAPHRRIVRGPDEVAIYQAVLADGAGRATYTLVRGEGWQVDNRLLPTGWSAAHPDAARTAPVGTADDPDFEAGGDRVGYRVTLPRAGAPGPLQIEVELCYQPANARWLAELMQYDLPEVRALRAMLASADLEPVRLARSTAAAGSSAGR